MKKKKEKEVKKSPILENYIPEEMIWAKTLSHRNEYTCGTISDNLSKMLRNVHDGIYDTLRLNGYNSVLDLESDSRIIKFYLLYVIVMLEIFCKTGIPYFFQEIRKPKVEFKLDRNSNVCIDLTDEDRLTSNVEKREKLGTLKDRFCPDKEKKNERAEALMDLRNLVYSNNFELRYKKLSNSKLTFTNWVNELLAKAVPDSVKLKKNLLSEESWVEILDLDELKEELRKLYQVNVKILSY